MVLEELRGKPVVLEELRGMPVSSAPEDRWGLSAMAAALGKPVRLERLYAKPERVEGLRGMPVGLEGLWGLRGVEGVRDSAASNLPESTVPLKQLQGKPVVWGSTATNSIAFRKAPQRGANYCPCRVPSSYKQLD